MAVGRGSRSTPRANKRGNTVFERSVLPNGLRVISASMPHTRSVSVGIFIGAGSRYEADDIAGASHFLEHMLFKGTARRPEPGMISSVIESVGGVLNASTDRELTVYWAKVAREHFPLALDLLADMLLGSTMPGHEVERERGVIIEELAASFDQPDALVDMLIDETMWPHQAMGRDVGGSRETVSAISREQLLAYYGRQYLANNAVLCVAGNVTHAEVTDAAIAQFGSWRGGDALDWQRVVPPANGIRVTLGQKRTDQAHVCIGMDGVPSLAPDRYAVDVLNTILGEGMTSRLFLEVRERRGLAYEVHSSSFHYRDCGALVVYCGVDRARVDTAVSAILGELDRLRDDVPADDVKRAVDFATGRMMLRLEDTRSVMSWLGAQELLHERVRTPDEVAANLRDVTTADVQKAAHDYLAPSAYKMAVVGPFRSEARFHRLLAS